MNDWYAGDGKVLYVYWGRRGSLSWIASGIAHHLNAQPELHDAISTSAENELAPRLAGGPKSWPFRTFARGAGALTALPRFLRDGRALTRRLKRERFDAVIVLMSHVWSPLLGAMVRRAGLRYAVIVHDARPHLGDRTALVNRWLLRDPRIADLVFTLTESVADDLVNDLGLPRDRVAIIAHPAITYGAQARRRDGETLRVLFLGRIMAYKGLPLLVDAVEQLRERGVPVSLGVFGEGDITALRTRLSALGAEVANRWINHNEIGEILARHDVLVLPYVEASQSGVAAAAHGAGLPVVATPVGGLGEQIRHRVDGLLAETVSGAAIADALSELAGDRGLYDRLAAGARESGGPDIPSFARQLKERVLSTPRRP